MKQIVRVAFSFLVLAVACQAAAGDFAGNWSAITSSSTGTSGYSLAVQESGGSYSSFIDDYDVDFIAYYASHATFNSNTLQFHLDWPPPGGFSFDGFVSVDGNTLNCLFSKQTIMATHS